MAHYLCRKEEHPCPDLSTEDLPDGSVRITLKMWGDSVRSWRLRLGEDVELNQEQMRKIQRQVIECIQELCRNAGIGGHGE